MAKRLLDIAVSFCALFCLSPLFVVVAIGIRLSSKGPIFYRALRAGRGGTPFNMYKFRTMDPTRSSFASAITAMHDPRIFPFGRLLRRYKIDELPQLINVLKGDMSLVGPRPEDLNIVRKAYTDSHFETLRVLPGLTSPGSLYNYTHGEKLLDGEDPEKLYVEQLLPIKLALDTVYARHASFAYDLLIILRTIWIIIAIAFGKRSFADPPEMNEALFLLEQCLDRDRRPGSSLSL